MSERVDLSAVVIDLSIYPRAAPSDDTVSRYAEALEEGAEFPSIVLETGTGRLLDGMHRYRAHERAGLSDIEARYVEAPTDVPLKVYAASFSTSHGDQISNADLKLITIEAYKANPELSYQTVASYFGRSRQTVSKWCSPVHEHRKLLRKVRAHMLTVKGLGGPELSNVDTAEMLGVTEGSIRNDVKDDIFTSLTEDLIAEALDGMPEECQAVADNE